MKEKIAVLKRMLDESNYTVALCGSGMLTDGGVRGIKNPDRAYAIERAYGASPEFLQAPITIQGRSSSFIFIRRRCSDIFRILVWGAMPWPGWSRPESFSASLRRTYLTRLSAAAAST